MKPIGGMDISQQAKMNEDMMQINREEVVEEDSSKIE